MNDSSVCANQKLEETGARFRCHQLRVCWIVDPILDIRLLSVSTRTPIARRQLGEEDGSFSTFHKASRRINKAGPSCSSRGSGQCVDGPGQFQDPCPRDLVSCTVRGFLEIISSPPIQDAVCRPIQRGFLRSLSHPRNWTGQQGRREEGGRIFEGQVPFLS